jgi:DNA helicase II / ATP-dependent DNA helicase PcrA
MSARPAPADLVTEAFPGLPAALTAGQREAVFAEHPVLCVLAGAGAGKTGVLTLRVARRSHDGTATANRTLVCTFSRKAADELRTRLWRLGVSGVTAGTIHRIALGLLRDWRERVGRPSPSVLGDRDRLIKSLLGDRAGARALASAEGEIGWAKARLVSPSAYAKAVHEAGRTVRIPVAAMSELYGIYEEERIRRGLLDLDDLLIEAAVIMETQQDFAEAVQWRHRHVLVDEAQDVNPAQFRLLRSLISEDSDVFFVGDPSQSVYGWNGADPGLLDHIPTDFPAARIIRLDENHRSTRAIVSLASAALGAPEPREATRPEGVLPCVVAHDDDEAEAHWVARQAWLARGPGRRWSHIAVLARTNAQLEVVADALRAQRIPFTRAGRDLGPASDLVSTRDGIVCEETTGTTGEEDGVDGVILSTFHRAKGLQWPCVFVIGLSEGLVPLRSARTESALAEERRLLYVAMTRAEDELSCTWARGTEARGARTRCRWLADIEDARATLVQERASPSTVAISAHMARLKALVS